MSLVVTTSCLIGSTAMAQAPLGGTDVTTIPDSDYVTVKDGHLSVRGERIRVWAAIGRLFCTASVTAKDTPAQKQQKVDMARRGTDLLMQRYRDLGFNGGRLWTGFHTAGDYQVGDGSAMDGADYFVAQAGKNGMRIWVASINSNIKPSPEDVSVIDDPATADAWAETVRSQRLDGRSIARAWDPRLEALVIRQMTVTATHFNKHNGLRWCDDPTFAIWELSNEEWWMKKMVGGQWQKLPDLFRNQLVAKWNGFLKGKYGDDSKLTTAWGKLLPGENIEKASLLLVPMAGKSKAAAALNDANPVAREAMKQVDQEYSRDDFSSQRGSDVIEFFMGLQLAHKQRVAGAIKALGKSTRLSPMVYDTGIGYEIQSQFLHQNADAVAHDAYTNGWGPSLEGELKKVDPAAPEQRKALAMQDAERISANSGPWVNWLLKPPGLHQGVPWLEQNRIEGKPFLAYETQIQQPAKYRADYPLRVAALASIQDWDWICWHYFQPPNDLASLDHPWTKPMDVTTGGHPQGYHYTYDEVQNSSMRTASQVFRNGLLKPAATPTVFVFGRKSLYNPASMDYAGSYGMSGLDMNYTTYQYGVRIKIDPTREDDEVIGPVVKFADRNTHNPYAPTDQICYDWKKGYLTFDAPAAVAFTGLLANYGNKVSFKNQMTVRDVQIKNDPGIYDPIRDNEKFIAFSIVSDDGQPLDQAKKATLSLVSTSFNSGFRMLKPDEKKGLSIGGSLPVLYARVGAVVQGPGIAGMKYRFLDWNMQEVGGGKVENETLAIPNDLPIFIVELTR